MRATALAWILVAALSGCTALRPGTPSPMLYALDGTPPVAGPAPAPASQGRPAVTPRMAAADAPTLVVNLPHAAAGYDSQRIIYLRQPYELQYFAQSQWADTPARMLQPLIAAAVERSGKFRAVVLIPASATGDFRLETEVLRLQQEFLSRPSRVRLSLRATITDMTTRRVVAWRQFDAQVPAASDDPYGGVIAANQAVRDVLEQLATFCADTTADVRPNGGRAAPPEAPSPGGRRHLE